MLSDLGFIYIKGSGLIPHHAGTGANGRSTSTRIQSLRGGQGVGRLHTYGVSPELQAGRAHFVQNGGYDGSQPPGRGVWPASQLRPVRNPPESIRSPGLRLSLHVLSCGNVSDCAAIESRPASLAPPKRA